MRSRARISTKLLRAVVAEAHASPDREICGLLLETEDMISQHRPALNVAADPRRAFEIDPATLLAAHRAQRSGGATVVGCYHSHPSSSPEPSARDAADAAPNGWWWLIVAGGRARLWRAVPQGRVHGRFDPADLACIEDAPPAGNRA